MASLMTRLLATSETDCDGADDDDDDDDDDGDVAGDVREAKAWASVRSAPLAAKSLNLTTSFCTIQWGVGSRLRGTQTSAAEVALFCAFQPNWIHCLGPVPAMSRRYLMAGAVNHLVSYPSNHRRSRLSFSRFDGQALAVPSNVLLNFSMSS